MHVQFESRSPAARQLEGAALHRTRFVMRRLADRVGWVRLQLSDVNGPRGGLDKRCRLALSRPGAPPLVVQAQARHWRAAIDLALARAAHALRRWLQRPVQRPTPRSSTSPNSNPEQAGASRLALPLDTVR